MAAMTKRLQIVAGMCAAFRQRHDVIDVRSRLDATCRTTMAA